MTSRYRITRRFGRWIAACCAIVAVAAPAPSSAYTFSLVSDPSGQHLNYLWESCFSGGSATVISNNGNIPYSSNGSGGNLAGGSLTWTTSSGSLSVLALSTVAATTGGTSSCSGRTGAVNVRDIPMVFSITPEPGDPFPLNVTLHVQPRLHGTVELVRTPGNVINLWLQMMATVSVDGQTASADSFYTILQLEADNDSLLKLGFPKGAANSVLIPNVTPGSEVMVRIWAYIRGYVQQVAGGYSSIYSSSVFGAGPAVEVLLRDQNALDVPAESEPTTLALAARPNPSPGNTRIEYVLPRASQVRVSVFDLAGARIATLVDRFESAGRGEVAWNARSARGDQLPPGIYVVELTAGGQRTVSKLVLLGR